MIARTTTIDPKRPLPTASSKPLPTPATSTPAANTPTGTTPESRVQQQQRYASNMWTTFGKNAQLAAIMFNPIFMVQAQAITSAAVGRAMHRWEFEAPQQDYSVLYAQEMGAARQAILAMPDAYAKYGEKALQATGDALLSAYSTTTQAVGDAAVATGNAVVTVAEATGHAAKTGVFTVVGAFAAVGRGILHGFGHVLHGIGNLFTGAGRGLEGVGT